MRPANRHIPCALAILGTAAGPVSAQTHRGAAPSRTPLPFASGTAWQPASASTHGPHIGASGWIVMVHGQGTLGYVADAGPRGDRAGYWTSMASMRVSHRLGPGMLQARLMASADPTMGSEGYPLLLQTGETADGFRPLYDRQHPHDLFMEIALLYRWQPGAAVAPFVYLAPVGEPAIGPTVFMHRTSGHEVPNAPIGHHFHDGTHVTYGVATLGVTIADRVKVEASIFRGREPDQHHWNIERPRFDSYSARVTVNPGPQWSFQVSVADVEEPEQIHPGLDVRKATASVSYHQPTGTGYWSSTASFGANSWAERTVTVAGVDFVVPARTQVALLLESALRVGRSTVFTRLEAAEKDELFDPLDDRHNEIYRVAKIDAGFVLDLTRWRAGHLGVGASGSIHFLPLDLEPVYGGSPASLRVFARLAVP